MDYRAVSACVNCTLELFEYDEVLLDGELDEYVCLLGPSMRNHSSLPASSSQELEESFRRGRLSIERLFHFLRLPVLEEAERGQSNVLKELSFHAVHQNIGCKHGRHLFFVCEMS